MYNFKMRRILLLIIFIEGVITSFWNRYFPKKYDKKYILVEGKNKYWEIIKI